MEIMKWTKAKGILTLIFLLATVFIYFILSSALLYIPTGPILAYGFSFSNPIGLITYSFLHVSPSHLLSNVLLFIPIGIIAEFKLRWKDYLAIYFLSGAVSAIVFGLTAPDTIIIGASAAISGLIAAAFMVDIKKALVGILVFSLLLVFIIPTVKSYTESQFMQLQNRSFVLEEQYDETQKEIIEAIEKNETERIPLLEEKRNTTIQEIKKTSEEQINIDIGMEREEKAESSPIVHLAGAFTGLAYLFAFRSDIILEMPSQVLSFKLSKKRKKRKRNK